jgi:hypothetical protein
MSSRIFSLSRRNRSLALAGVLLAAALGLGWYFVACDRPAAPYPGAAEERLAGPPMSEEQRRRIWDVEHHVLVLSKYWFGAFAQALKNAQAPMLASMLAADFKGQKPRAPAEERLDAPFAQLVRRKDTGVMPIVLDRAAFVAEMLEYRKPFVHPPHVELYPTTLMPQEQDHLDGRWHGTAVLRLWGEVGPGQPGEVVLRLEFGLPFPLENTQPGWLGSCAIKQAQVARAPRFLLRDVTRARGIDPAWFHDNWVKHSNLPSAGSIFLADFNRDGMIDVLISDIQRLALYQGLPDGKFKDVTEAMGLPLAPPPQPDFIVAGFVDIDGDGWEDLILAGEIYRNEKGQGFVNCTAATDLRFPQNAAGISFVDYDGDGLIDIYVSVPGKGDWLNGRTRDGSGGNRLWKNLGGWKFKEVSKEANAGGGRRSVYSAVWLDADNDGRPDVYLPNELGNGVLLVNRGDGTFREHLIMSGPQDFGTMGLTAGDLDNDGHTDLYLANRYSRSGGRILGNVPPGTYSEPIMATMRRFAAGSQLYLNRGNLVFQPVAEAWQMNDVGWAHGAALVDLDNDGFLDVFAATGFLTVSRDEPDGAGCWWQSVAAQPFDRSAQLPAPGKVDPNIGEFWVANLWEEKRWQAASVRHNLACRERQRLYLNAGGTEGRVSGFFDLSFLSGADAEGDGRCVVAADFRNNGQLDLIVRKVGGGSVTVYENQFQNAAAKRHYLEVSLRGRKSNSLGIGAHLVAEVAGRRIHRDLYPVNSFKSQMPCRVHFGLKDAATVDRLTICWPSGQVQVLTRLAADRHIVVEEGKEGADAVETVVPGKIFLP